jgi:DNA primase
MISDETLDRIRELDSQEVGERLGLEPDNEAKKYSCPVCPDTNGYRIKPEPDSGGHCFYCGETHGDNVAMAQAITGFGFTEAVEKVASQFGIEVKRSDNSEDNRQTEANQPQRQSVDRTVEQIIERAAIMNITGTWTADKRSRWQNSLYSRQILPSIDAGTQSRPMTLAITSIASATRLTPLGLSGENWT